MGKKTFNVSAVVGTGCLLFIIWHPCHYFNDLSITAGTVVICIWKTRVPERKRDVPLHQESNIFKVQRLLDSLHALLPCYLTLQCDICWNLPKVYHQILKLKSCFLFCIAGWLIVATISGGRISTSLTFTLIMVQNGSLKRST